MICLCLTLMVAQFHLEVVSLMHITTTILMKMLFAAHFFEICSIRIQICAALFPKSGYKFESMKVGKEGICRSRHLHNMTIKNRFIITQNS